MSRVRCGWSTTIGSLNLFHGPETDLFHAPET
jgi:hypothetical protein